METTKLSPEDVQKIERFNERVAAANAAFKDSLKKRSLFFFRAIEKGAIPLDVLLLSLAGDPIRETAPIREQIFGPYPDSSEPDTGYRIILRHAKRDIRSGALKVRHLPTIFPVNEFPVIQAWCNTNDTLMTYDEMRPDSRLVVKIEDACQWLTKIGVSVPGWLRVDNKSVAGNCHAVAADNLSGMSPDSIQGNEVPKASSTATSGGWIPRARAEGFRIAKKSPLLSVEQIAKKVRAWMVIEKIAGRGGRVPAESSIKKHALTGIKK